MPCLVNFLARFSVYLRLFFLAVCSLINVVLAACEAPCEALNTERLLATPLSCCEVSPAIIILRAPADVVYSPYNLSAQSD